MSRLWKYRPSPAMIVATLALFVAMGGTGYAVSKLPKGSVGAAQLRKDAVRSKHIKAGSITKAKLAQSTLSALRGETPAGVGGPVTSSAAPDRVDYADRSGYADKSGYADEAGYADRAGSLDAAAAASIAAQAADAVIAGLPDNPTGSDNIRWIEPITIEAGEEEKLLDAGPYLSLKARCRVNRLIDGHANQDQADILISTTRDGAAFDGDDLLGKLDVNDDPESRQFVNTTIPTATGAPRFEASSDGLAIGHNGVVYIKGSYLFAGVNVNGKDGECIFGGYIFL